MKRRLIASLLMVLMLLTLTACGGGASKSEEAGGNWAADDMAVEESVSHSMTEAPMEMGYLEDAIYDGKGHTGYTGTPVAKLIGTPSNPIIIKRGEIV